MGYLMPAEYALYGLAADTPDALVTMASGLMEAHCRRSTLMAATYTQRMRLSAGTQTARLSYGPIDSAALQTVRVRYAQARRGEYDLTAQNILGLEIATAFGLPGMWSTLDPTTVDVYPAGGELCFRPSLLGLAYNEVEVTYTAGFVTVPEQIKIACAQIVKNAMATPALNVKSSRMDTMQMQYFGPTLIDDGVRVLLKPYIAEKL